MPISVAELGAVALVVPTEALTDVPLLMLTSRALLVEVTALPEPSVNPTLAMPVAAVATVEPATCAMFVWNLEDVTPPASVSRSVLAAARLPPVSWATLLSDAIATGKLLPLAVCPKGGSGRYVIYPS